MKIDTGNLTPEEYANSLALLLGAGCPTPEKKRFASHEGAIRWRVQAEKKGLWNHNLYPYKCHGSSHWHLTKGPQEGW